MARSNNTVSSIFFPIAEFMTVHIMSPTLAFLPLFAGLAYAQFPAEPTGTQVITSKLNSDVKLSYKQVLPPSIYIDSPLTPISSITSVRLQRG